MGRLISEYLREEDNLAGLLITSWDFPFSPSFAMKGREGVGERGAFSFIQF